MKSITPHSHAVITLAATLAAATLGLHIHAALVMGALLYAQPPVWLMGALVALYMAVCGYNLSQMERR